MSLRYRKIKENMYKPRSFSKEKTNNSEITIGRFFLRKGEKVQSLFKLPETSVPFPEYNFYGFVFRTNILCFLS